MVRRVSGWSRCEQPRIFGVWTSSAWDTATLTRAQRIQASIDWNQSRPLSGYSNIKEVPSDAQRQRGLPLFDRDSWAPTQVFQYKRRTKWPDGKPVCTGKSVETGASTAAPAVDDQVQGARPPALQPGSYEEPYDEWGNQSRTRLG